MAAFMREDFARVGWWSEQLGQTYGKEDTDLCRRAGNLLERSRDRCQGLFHVWHPTDFGYRSKYHKPRGGAAKRTMKVVKVRVKRPVRRTKR
jgi:hypothetical protein